MTNYERKRILEKITGERVYISHTKDSVCGYMAEVSAMGYCEYAVTHGHATALEARKEALEIATARAIKDLNDELQKNRP